MDMRPIPAPLHGMQEEECETLRRGIARCLAALPRSGLRRDSAEIREALQDSLDFYESFAPPRGAAGRVALKPEDEDLVAACEALDARVAALAERTPGSAHWTRGWPLLLQAIVDLARSEERRLLELSAPTFRSVPPIAHRHATHPTAPTRLNWSHP